MLRSLVIGAATAGLVGAGAAGLGAQERIHDPAVVTFSGPVEIPGHLLEPGTYQFKLAHPERTERIVGIWSEDGSRHIATLLTIPTVRGEITQDMVELYRPTEIDGGPPALKAWYHLGEQRGLKFVYTPDQARRIAKEANADVPSAAWELGDDIERAVDTAVNVVTPSGDERPYEDLQATTGTTPPRN